MSVSKSSMNRYVDTEITSWLKCKQFCMMLTSFYCALISALNSPIKFLLNLYFIYLLFDKVAGVQMAELGCNWFGQSLVNNGTLSATLARLLSRIQTETIATETVSIWYRYETAPNREVEARWALINRVAVWFICLNWALNGRELDVNNWAWIGLEYWGCYMDMNFTWSRLEFGVNLAVKFDVY